MRKTQVNCVHNMVLCLDLPGLGIFLLCVMLLGLVAKSQVPQAQLSREGSSLDAKPGDVHTTTGQEQVRRNYPSMD